MRCAAPHLPLPCRRPKKAATLAIAFALAFATGCITTAPPANTNQRPEFPVSDDAAKRCLKDGSASCYATATQLRSQGELHKAEHLFRVLCGQSHAESCLQVAHIWQTLKQGQPEEGHRLVVQEFLLSACDLDSVKACGELLTLHQSSQLRLPPPTATRIANLLCTRGRITFCEAALQGTCESASAATKSGSTESTPPTHQSIMQMLKDGLSAATKEKCQSSTPVALNSSTCEAASPEQSEFLQGILERYCHIPRAEFFDFLAM